VTGMRIRDVFGLSPLPLRAREAWVALRGGPDLPKTRYDLSSLGVLHPTLALRTWMGARRDDRRVPITNLFNRTRTPPELGWSVKKSQVRDFLGGDNTYDSHNGTDFAVPIGTVVVAAAPGVVLRVSSEFNRGGLKVFIDHGGGLATTSNHLGESLVEVGQQVRRGQPIALSAYSGIDAVVTFPWGVPHVHFNVWLGGEYVDPFAAPGEIALWRGGNDPQPSDEVDEPFTPTRWNEAGVAAAVRACKHPETRAALEDERALDRRAMNVMFAMNYYPTRFTEIVTLMDEVMPRGPVLSLPFRKDDFAGIVLQD